MRRKTRDTFRKIEARTFSLDMLIFGCFSILNILWRGRSFRIEFSNSEFRNLPFLQLHSIRNNAIISGLIFTPDDMSVRPSSISYRTMHQNFYYRVLLWRKNNNNKIKFAFAQGDELNSRVDFELYAVLDNEYSFCEMVVVKVVENCCSLFSLR